MGKAKVTKYVFDLVKLILKGGATIEKAAEMARLSPWTIRAIKNAGTIEEYYSMTRRSRKTETQKPQETDEKPAVSGSWMLERIFDEAKKQTALLTAISDKLADIVVELTGTPEGTGENAEQDD